MKKIKYIVLLTMMIVLSGCVRYDSTMDIKINKSMNFSMIMALDKTMTSMMGSENPFEEIDKGEAEKYGFKVSSFEEGNMKGIKLEKKIKNIDKASIGEENIFDLSNLTKKDESFIFQVKKGFFKNTYIAKIKLETNGMMNERPDMDNTLTDVDFDMSDSPFGNLDYESMMESMDLKFNVHLPFGAISNNATNASNHNKDLVWDLVKLNNEYIEFEFSLFNGIPILVIFSALLFLIIMAIVVFKNNDKNKEKKNKNLDSLSGLDVSFIPTSENNNQMITETSNVQPLINNTVQPSVTVPLEVNRVNKQEISELSNAQGSLKTDLNFDQSNNNASIPSNSFLNINSEMNGIVSASPQETRLVSSNETEGTQVNKGLIHSSFTNDSSATMNPSNETVHTELGSLENNQSQSSCFNTKESNFFNNSEKMNNNQLSPSLSKEQNMDSVNGQVMQDLKVEDVFNVTQIQEIENGQIKNSNDNGF